MSTTSVTQVLAGHGVHTAEGSIHVDMVPAELVECALARKRRASSPPTARSWSRPASTPGAAPRTALWWTPPTCTTRSPGATWNVPISQESYEKVRDGVAAYLSDRDIYVVRGLAGADRGHARKFMVTCELASQALFITQLLVRPTDEERAEYGEPDFTILAAPGSSATQPRWRASTPRRQCSSTSQSAPWSSPAPNTLARSRSPSSPS